MKRIEYRLLAITFVIIIFICGITNFIKMKDAIKYYLTSEISVQDKIKGIDEVYRTSFSGRDEFIELYGLSKVVTCSKIIGQYEFIKDKFGIIHQFKFKVDNTRFNQEVITVNNLVKQTNTPFLYVQVPAREIRGFSDIPYNVADGTNENIDEIIENLSLNNIDYLDLREGIEDKENFFFKTDVHPKMETEYWIFKKVVMELENRYGIKLDNKEQLFNIANYNVEPKEFLGNFSRSSGVTFSGVDIFNQYLPKFSTSFKLVDYADGTTKEGNFEEVIMNGFQDDKSKEDKMKYWIINYLKFPSPLYEITNNGVKNNNILMIMDSNGIGATSFLTLGAHNITVVDTRYQKNRECIKEALALRKYDAVVMLQIDFLSQFPLFPEYPQTTLVSTDAPEELEKGKVYNMEFTFKNTGLTNWNAESKIGFGYLGDNYTDYGYRIMIPEGVEVKPGELYTFKVKEFAVHTNDEALNFRMLIEGKDWLGEDNIIKIR